ncbi:MAG TPA: glycosyltransferase, partial [Thermoanaerobaculia bacterium]|nr:glycosyltransferase [Thermoanaerobaculia bacterium]
MKARKIVIFGLTVSSSWGNGHATLWRALLRSLAAQGHRAVFFERDVPYYAAARDLHHGLGYDLVLYRDWAEALPLAEQALSDADVGIVTSYCPDATAATELVVSKKSLLHVFYDLDTPVTLDRLDRGETVEYLPHDGLSRFNLVLSFTGGRALDELRTRLGAKRALPLYGSVDASAHRPVAPRAHYQADLSYLGTYAPDRQEAVERLFVGAARALPDKRFVLGGSMYPSEFPWTDNIHFFHHVPPREHSAFYCSSKLTLNVTRGAMAARGYCPSGRLFEAASCGTPILSDTFDGLDTFFEPDKEI